MALPFATRDAPHARGSQVRGQRQCGPLPSLHHPRIVALGGGTGLPAVLRGLAAAGLATEDPDTITAVVTVTDDGGSSGRLREQFGVLPPGDIRNCLVALAHSESAAEFLQHRFADDQRHEPGHAVGNLLLTALTQVTGDFSQAIAHLAAFVGSRGRVLPTTLENVRLRAQMESGEFVIGETAIVTRPSRIKRLWLSPSPRPDPQVLRALINADAIVVGPGSLYTSVLPNLLVEGVAATIYGANAVRVYVANLMTQPGETDGYSLDDHLRTIREHTGFGLFDYILVNRAALGDSVLQRYAADGAQPVMLEGPLQYAGHARTVECDLAVADADGVVRHDPGALARTITSLMDTGRVPG